MELQPNERGGYDLLSSGGERYWDARVGSGTVRRFLRLAGTAYPRLISQAAAVTRIERMVAMEDPVVPLVLRPKLLQRLKLVLLGVAMVAVSLFLAVQSSLEARFIGAVGLAFFLPCLVYSLFRATRGGAALVVTREGFTDRSSAVGVGFVPWNNVADIDVVEIAGQRMVALTLGDPAAVLAEAPPVKRWVLRANPSFGAHLFLPQLWLPIPVETLADIMERARAAGQRGQRSGPRD